MKQKLEELFDASLKLTVPDVHGVEPKIKISVGRKGDYQWFAPSFTFNSMSQLRFLSVKLDSSLIVVVCSDNVMSLWPRIKGKGTQIEDGLALGQVGLCSGRFEFSGFCLLYIGCGT